uniref:ATP synthase subunit a n=1 Tax=Monotoma quadricollis TaxID=346807 RepID=A0A343A3N8_9CUCU|nr:ATP synthase F0 subunit 6 [Monotoma quadricollis]AOY39166.1 ATP synthase F0 subunit 6 [Monotoma quadricollis]
MMANLFSSFDPATTFNMSLNWLSTIIGLLIIPPMFWLIPSRLSILWFNIIITLHKEFKILINKSNGSTLIFISLFSLILFNNFMGLFPYIFTSTSHMTMSLALALPLWLTFMLFGWIQNTTHMFSHLIPVGTPPILMPFMVCIETISNIIRPGTLAIRLSANIIAGHLLMTLMGNTGPSLSLLLMNILIISQILLLILETAVSIIQSYVFTVLSTLYSSEVI